MIAILEKLAGCKADDILEDSAMDSLDFTQFILDVDQAFGSKIPMARAMEFKTLRDVEQYLLAEGFANALEAALIRMEAFK